MLGKLMKYEWKATWKLLLGANLLLVIMSALASWTVRVVMSSYETSNMMDFMAVMIIITYVISMLAVYVGTAIFLIHRFYTSTYGDQGYLLHTLPVDTHHIIIAKTLVSAIWMMINSALILLSVIFLAYSEEDAFISMMEGMVDVIEFYGAETATLFTAVMTLIAGIFSIFAKVLKVGACISLGQLSANHKLLCSIGWYVAFYLVERVCEGIYHMIRLAFSDHSSYFDVFSYYYDSQWETTLIAGILSCVLFYILTWYVMSRKLNLD